MRTTPHSWNCSPSAVLFIGLIAATISVTAFSPSLKADDQLANSPPPASANQKTTELEASTLNSGEEDSSLLRFVVRNQAAAFAPGLLDFAHVLLVDAVWARDYKQALQESHSARPGLPGVREKLRNFDDSLLGATQSVIPAVGVISKVVSADDAKVPANVIYVRFSKPFLETYFCKQYERQMPVRDVVLGANVYGTSRTVARTELGLVDNPDAAQANLLFKGTTTFNTTSYKGPVRIYSHGTTQFVAEKKLSFDGEAIQQSKPKTWADTNTITDGISTDLPRLRGRIVLRIAGRRAAESHEQAEQIANERTKHKVEHAFENVVKERTTAFSQRLTEQYAKLPFEGRFSLRAIQCSTTPDSLQLVVLGRGDLEPTYTQAPSSLKNDPDIELHIHTALVQKAIFDPEMRMALQTAVRSMVDNPVNTVATVVRTAGTAEPQRELHIHWMEGEGEWLSLAWHAKEKLEEREAANFATTKATSGPLVSVPTP